jgi:hypothetical protein
MSTCSAPAWLSSNWTSTLVYNGNPNYTAQDLAAVTTQLDTEMGYENSLYSLCGVMRELTNNTTTTLKGQLKAVGDSISSSLSQKALDAQMQVDELSRYAKYATVGSSIPAIGPAFSAVAATLSASAALVPSQQGIPGHFTYTLAQLNSQTNDLFGARLSLVNTALFTAISSDWGKLQVIGRGWGRHEKPWYFCSNCDDAALPLSSLPVISLGAKRNYYRILLPTAYSVDRLVGRSNSDPRVIVRRVLGYGGADCYKPYLRAPEDSYWSYPSINVPSTWDISVLTETAMVRGPGYDELRFPTTSLLTDMLDAPEINIQQFTLTGGAGISTDDFIRAGFRMPQRPGYLPGTDSPYCTSGQ